MDSKRQKLLDQFNENAEPLRNTSSQIFRGVVIYVNGYTNPSADILRQHMAKYGGQYSTYLTKDVTHVVATNLCWTKIDKLNDKSPKIVHPQWITAW
uniref:BRCT domain-containing protein n=1 Tax=Romanomermis culicivorax TaxID=13658 RepID=A0A915KGP6_ROMCU